MKTKKRNYIFATLAVLGILASACERGDLSVNPNAASASSVISPDLFVNRLTNEIYNGGGVMDKYTNSQAEGPWSQVMRWNQYYVSNYSYYWGTNFYNWSNTANAFSMLKYADLMDGQVETQANALINADAYRAFVKFYKAYSFIWYTQRVGDIPMTQAGSTNNLAPAFDKQKQVYANCLALLDTANTLMNNYITKNNAAATTFSSGDIYKLTNLQWQKVINTYKLRVLLSLSKRASDNADLNIPQQFAAIVNDPTGHPIMTTMADNIVYKFNASYNPYPIKANGDQPYTVYTNVSDTYLGLTTPVQDPRTFIAATPAPSAITAGKTASDFTAYIGSDVNTGQSALLTNSTNGAYSYVNSLYYGTADGTAVEPYIVIGYPELCFNIAEAINRGWVAGGSSSTWYTNGIKASMSLYGLTDGQQYKVYDKTGKTLIGTVTISVSNFLTNVAYKGDNSDGLTQILQQKYVAMWQNSGWEPFYNWRRTGVPAFVEGGPGIGTTNNLIPRRWKYDNNEIVANPVNYSSAISSQYGGSDDISKDIWAVQ